MTAKEIYDRGRTARASQVASLDGTSRRIALGRLVSAIGAVVLTGASVWGNLPRTSWGAVAGLVVVFVALVIVHARVLDRLARAQAAQRFHERGLLRLADDWKSLPSTGDRFKDDAHPFASDLDLFGKASLFQLLDTSETRFGEERLAAWLKGAEGSPDMAALRDRQAAVRELCPRWELREKLAMAGAVLAEGKPDPEPLLKWAEGSTSSSTPIAVLLGAWSTLIVVAIVMGTARGWPAAFYLLPYSAAFVFSLATRARTAPTADAVSAREGGFGAYAEIFAAIEAEPLREGSFERIRAELRATGSSVEVEMRSLGTIVGFLDARQNEVFRLFLAPVLFWEHQCVFLLEKWRARSGKHVRAWFSALGEVEALASLATIAFEKPAFGWPEITDDLVFSAKSLAHPLIASSRRVANDVGPLEPGHALVVTGSNMSGKSTLLRAIGTNAALALAGAPVCAETMRIGPIAVATSMRVADSLAEGTSHFYAELKRLKQVVDLAYARRGVLFLLDEILHGTNSRERLIGARATVRDLLEHGAMGAVSTHDLGLAEIERELGAGAARNVHFQEQVTGETMTFDYKLRDGVVQSSNALRVMKMVGLRVPD